MTKRFYSILLALFALAATAGAQTISDSSNRRIDIDSAMAAPATPDRKSDSLQRLHTPRKAAIRSAILPGLGQVYNHKYWKVPIVYAAIGVPTVLFFYNLTWYRRTRYAYSVLAEHRTGEYANVHPQLQSYITYNALGSLQRLRNEFRRDVDYSALFIIVMWGLNVVDASVDAHLKTFDVNPDLSFRLKGGYSELAGTNGVSLIVSFH